MARYSILVQFGQVIHDYASNYYKYRIETDSIDKAKEYAIESVIADHEYHLDDIDNIVITEVANESFIRGSDLKTTLLDLIQKRKEMIELEADEKEYQRLKEKLGK